MSHLRAVVVSGVDCGVVAVRQKKKLGSAFANKSRTIELILGAVTVMSPAFEPLYTGINMVGGAVDMLTSPRLSEVSQG